jgi:xanthine dehydrogenase accessory factor
VELVHSDARRPRARAKLDSRSAVVALTHDPKLDDLALMEALKSDAFYVGAIGSRVNNARRRERLREFDLSEEQLAKPARPDRPVHRQQDAVRDRASRSWPS